MLRRLRGRFGGMFRGGGDFRGMGWTALAALLIAAWFASGVYIVQEGEQAVVTRFGGYHRVTGPGLHVHLPFPVENAHVVSVTAQRQTSIGFNNNEDVVAESLMLTGDKSIVDIDFSVQWQLSDIRAYVFNLRDPDDAVKAVAESAMREVIGRRQLDAIITSERQGVEQATRDLMQRTLDSYQAGVLVQQVQLRKAAAPANVNDAFQDVIKAGQDAQTRINEADRYANEKLPQARGDAARMTQEAEAYRDRVVREALGEAERFRLVHDQYRKAPRVTRERIYLETMERVYGGAEKVILDNKNGGVTYLPLDQLRRGATPSTAPAPGAGAAGGQ